MPTAVKITAATLNLLDQLRLAGEFPGCMRADLRERFLNHGAAFAVVEEDHALGAGGVLPLWPGVGLLWLAVSDDFRKQPRFILIHTLEIISMIQRHGNFHRLQMYIDPMSKRDIRFAEALGFTFEGKMCKHTPDQRDHLLYARIF